MGLMKAPLAVAFVLVPFLSSALRLAVNVLLNLPTELLTESPTEDKRVLLSEFAGLFVFWACAFRRVLAADFASFMRACMRLINSLKVTKYL